MGDAEWLIGTKLLPLDSDLMLMALFAELDRRPWGSVASFKGAVRAWHVVTIRRGPKGLLFWRGLEKRAGRIRSRAKRPLEHSELLDLQ